MAAAENRRRAAMLAKTSEPQLQQGPLSLEKELKWADQSYPVRKNSVLMGF